MNSSQPEPRQVLQCLRWGAHVQQRFAPPDTLFAVTGRRIYALGDIDGRFRPRSNPYDVYSFGGPRPDDPLAGRLQGVWAQPVKGMSAYGYSIEVDGVGWELDDAQRFTQSFDSVTFEFQRAGLRAIRCDYAALDAPLLFSTLTLRNQGAAPLNLCVAFNVTFDLQDAWFTTLAGQRNTGETVDVLEDRLIARAATVPGRWAAAVGGAGTTFAAQQTGANAGRLAGSLELLPGGEQTLVFGLTVEAQGGAPAALGTLAYGLPRSAELLDEKQAFYQGCLERGPHLHSPDPAFDRVFDLARANLHLLEAEQPLLGRYFYAGLEIFPFWFSCDGAYSLAGLMASGLQDSALNHLRIGLRYLDAGRVPHQISPSGQVAFAGNAEETPLWVLGAWDAFRWNGDRQFLAEMFPGAWKGMFEYVLGTIDPDGDGYPSGPGMVEVEGMGPEKLDSAAYTWAALVALAEMATVLGDDVRAGLARGCAGAIAAKFEADWWDEQGGAYAMSLLDDGNAQYPLPHWAVIVPLEVGLAQPASAARTFATLRADYLNRWGLKHTVGADERVWTLPTATLSRAAYQYNEPVLGFDMLRKVAATLDYGPIGLFHELIPEGACILQLWSAAVFLRGVIEDLLGIQVDADAHRIRISPQLPEGWGKIELRDLAFGAHRVSVRVEGGAVVVEHHQGPGPLLVACTGADWAPLAPEKFVIDKGI